MMTAADRLTHYKRDGFLILKDFVPATICDELRERAGQLVQEFDPAGVPSVFTTHEQSRLTDEYFMDSADKVRCFFEEDAFLPDGTLKQTKERSINKIGHALHALDPVFKTFSHSAKIRELVADLQIEEPQLIQSMYIFKQPKIGGEVACHQDSTFLYNEPIDIAGLWFALEDATLENGCLWVIPGGQRLGLKSRWVRSAEGGMRFEIFDETPFPDENLIPLEVNKGSVIVLHGLLPHKSLANRSEKSRHAYTLHFIGGRSRYAPENWLQTKLLVTPKAEDFNAQI